MTDDLPTPLTFMLGLGMGIIIAAILVMLFIGKVRDSNCYDLYYAPGYDTTISCPDNRTLKILDHGGAQCVCIPSSAP